MLKGQKVSENVEQTLLVHHCMYSDCKSIIPDTTRGKTGQHCWKDHKTRHWQRLANSNIKAFAKHIYNVKHQYHLQATVRQLVIHCDFCQRIGNANTAHRDSRSILVHHSSRQQYILVSHIFFADSDKIINIRFSKKYSSIHFQFIQLKIIDSCSDIILNVFKPLCQVCGFY